MSLWSTFKSIISNPFEEISNVVQATGDIVRPIVNDLRDPLESLAVTAGNYFLPGSSIFTKNLASKGSQEQLNSGWGKLAQLGSGLAGASAGNGLQKLFGSGTNTGLITPTDVNQGLSYFGGSDLSSSTPYTLGGSDGIFSSGYNQGAQSFMDSMNSNPIGQTNLNMIRNVPGLSMSGESALPAIGEETRAFNPNVGQYMGNTEADVTSIGDTISNVADTTKGNTMRTLGDMWNSGKEFAGEMWNDINSPIGGIKKAPSYLDAGMGLGKLYGGYKSDQQNAEALAEMNQMYDRSMQNADPFAADRALASQKWQQGVNDPSAGWDAHAAGIAPQLQAAAAKMAAGGRRNMLPMLLSQAKQQYMGDAKSRLAAYNPAQFGAGSGGNISASFAAPLAALRSRQGGGVMSALSNMGQSAMNNYMLSNLFNKGAGTPVGA